MGHLRDHLSAYRAAIKANPECVAGLTKNTRDRYRNAAFPRAVLWLLRHPELLRALAYDAEHGDIPRELLDETPDLVSDPS